ncbi:hypothetical protein GOEFS_079_00110 [Gordonia effusa NBRC 100432]|uniref:Uncharacterized protein n=1 Tax=Gordonia effusa NBRC 100432 TaxID=1077974 RepID=H0R2I2_9ACTN|nr:hypothetical protein GOEFS_079_00110 [Gordonia effusa NBRC 100432]
MPFGDQPPDRAVHRVADTRAAAAGAFAWRCRRSHATIIANKLAFVPNWAYAPNAMINALEEKR